MWRGGVQSDWGKKLIYYFSISKTFSLYDSPLTNDIDDFGILRCFERSSITFLFALPFSGGTDTLTSKLSLAISITSLLRELGLTFTFIRTGYDGIIAAKN